MKLLNKKNYSAWTIQPQDFPKGKNLEEQIKFLLRFAILAPSGHNSQPWNFKLKSNILEIFINKERFLTASDEHGRQSYIAFGCLIENLFLAANYFNFTCDIQYFPDIQMPELVSSIEFTKKGELKNESGHLINYINKRLSNRTKYTPQIPEKGLITNICKIASGQSTITPVEGEAKNLLAKIMSRAQIEVMDNPNFRYELSNYIKSNTTSSYYGMPGFTLGIPLPVSYIVPKLIKKINLSRISKKQDTKLLINNTPTIFVICAKNDEKSDWLAAGRTLENLWLTCAKYNLSCSVLAAAVQVSRSRTEVQKLLNSNSYPQVIVRCGYSNHKVKNSPRHHLENLMS